MVKKQQAPEIKVAADNAALNLMAVEEFCRCAKAAIAAHNRFCVALSGGNTPRAVYSLLATKKDALPWDKIYIFFGDERHVPPEHSDSNYRMANESLLSRVPLPMKNIYRVHAELDAKVAAQEYEDQLREFYQLQDIRLQNNDWPQFDLILLGLGDDGHTASLFPGSLALTENTRMVVANWVKKFNEYRITLTFPVLNQAAQVMFLVSGESKAQILKDVLNLDSANPYPAQRVQPVNGRLLWLLDQPAARLL
jgi:6-phosphogluconolactonase